MFSAGAASVLRIYLPAFLFSLLLLRLFCFFLFPTFYLLGKPFFCWF